ncbi:MAG TPA: divalent-cation tolerance protein CutA [Candidatus Omnitrophota bacterium]|nr:divalent-cation tolerance protein CutA [Candidatus Omnitrophota bacterium]
MFIVVFVTCSNKREALSIAKGLIKQRLCACVNIIKNIESIFWWQGKIGCAKEILLVIKSRKSRLAKIIKLVKSLHSYEVPEIIALPVIGGHKPYLEWLDDSIR